MVKRNQSTGAWHKRFYKDPDKNSLNRCGLANYNIEYPPSIRHTAPVMYEEASEAR